MVKIGQILLYIIIITCYFISLTLDGNKHQLFVTISRAGLIILLIYFSYRAIKGRRKNKKNESSHNV